MRIVGRSAVNPLAIGQKNVPYLLGAGTGKIAVVIASRVGVNQFKEIRLIDLEQFAVVKRPQKIGMVDLSHRAGVP